MMSQKEYKEREVMKKQLICALIIAVFCVTALAVVPNLDPAFAAKPTKWTNLQKKYQKDPKVKELVFVKYNGRNKTYLYMYKKNKKNQWKKVLSCKAYVGQYGINKVREGDRRTPTGDFPLEQPFGILKNPGSIMPYTQVNQYLYWCGDRSHYNKMVDIRTYPHKCRGEHLKDYPKQYAYAMNIGYNPKGEWGKGSAIFLHCFGYARYTLGCVAVSQKNMKKILKTVEPGSRICIYKK